MTEFSKKTGDYPSLSATDIRVLALTYQLQLEHEGAEHLREEPLLQVNIQSTPRHPETPVNVPGFHFPSKVRSVWAPGGAADVWISSGARLLVSSSSSEGDRSFKHTDSRPQRRRELQQLPVLEGTRGAARQRPAGVTGECQQVAPPGGLVGFVSMRCCSFRVRRRSHMTDGARRRTESTSTAFSSGGSRRPSSATSCWPYWLVKVTTGGHAPNSSSSKVCPPHRMKAEPLGQTLQLKTGRMTRIKRTNQRRRSLTAGAGSLPVTSDKSRWSLLIGRLLLMSQLDV